MRNTRGSALLSATRGLEFVNRGLISQNAGGISLKHRGYLSETPGVFLKLPGKRLAGLARFERATIDLEGRCSIQLSYSPIQSL